ncbi:hypothetical protein [Zhongshania sp.]
MAVLASAELSSEWLIGKTAYGQTMLMVLLRHRGRNPLGDDGEALH